MGVDIIEAGFPIASNGDFEAVSRDRQARQERRRLRPRPRQRQRHRPRRRRRCVHAERRRIHTFIGTSPLHRQYQLQLDQDQVHERVVASVTRARNYTDDVEWSPMDATRTEHDFLCRVVEAAIKAGATTINIPDTVGYADAGGVPRADRDAARARAGRRQGGLLDPLPQRPRPGGRQFAGRRRSAARARSNAPSTASASAPATPRWKRS